MDPFVSVLCNPSKSEDDLVLPSLNHVEAVFCQNLTCCGLILSDFHELMKHNETHTKSAPHAISSADAAVAVRKSWPGVRRNSVDCSLPSSPTNHSDAMDMSASLATPDASQPSTPSSTPPSMKAGLPKPLNKIRSASAKAFVGLSRVDESPLTPPGTPISPNNKRRKLSLPSIGSCEAILPLTPPDSMPTSPTIEGKGYVSRPLPLSPAAPTPVSSMSLPASPVSSSGGGKPLKTPPIPRRAGSRKSSTTSLDGFELTPSYFPPMAPISYSYSSLAFTSNNSRVMSATTLFEAIPEQEEASTALVANDAPLVVSSNEPAATFADCPMLGGLETDDVVEEAFVAASKEEEEPIMESSSNIPPPPSYCSPDDLEQQEDEEEEEDELLSSSMYSTHDSLSPTCSSSSPTFSLSASSPLPGSALSMHSPSAASPCSCSFSSPVSIVEDIQSTVSSPEDDSSSEETGSTCSSSSPLPSSLSSPSASSSSLKRSCSISSSSRFSSTTATSKPVTTCNISSINLGTAGSAAGGNDMLDEAAMMDAAGIAPYSPTYSADRQYKCTIAGCDKAYKNANGLKYHILHGHQEEVESSDKPHRCPVSGCGKSYKNANGLKYHAVHTHPKLLEAIAALRQNVYS